MHACSRLVCVAHVHVYAARVAHHHLHDAPHDTQALIDGVKIVYDLAFWHLMTDAEKMSMRQQLMYSYSVNRHATQPCHMVLTDCNVRGCACACANA